MSNDLLIHATGLCALAINVYALVRTCERSLRVHAGISGLAWALNNLLIGAHTAAALSLVSAGRTATSAVTLHGGATQRRLACLGFTLLTIAISAVTWHGWPSVLMAVASLLSTYAMFHLRGLTLRVSMLVVSALWMHNAWAHDSWEQMLGNAISAAAALWGAWRVDRLARASATVETLTRGSATVEPLTRASATVEAPAPFSAAAGASPLAESSTPAAPPLQRR